MREDIVRCLALVEALIDFGEGEDIEEGVFDEGTWGGLFGREGVCAFIGDQSHAQRGDGRNV